MDSLNLIATFYKQELADANEQKILYKTQCELHKQEIQQLKEQLKQANDEIAKFRNEQAAQNEAVEQVEAEIIE